MRILIGIFGLLLLLAILWDSFESVILPRHVQRSFRIARFFYRNAWSFCSFTARHIRNPKLRESYLSYFGPLSLLLLIGFWALAMVLAFAMLQWAAGSALAGPGVPGTFRTDLYFSGTTFFTLGLGDITPQTSIARIMSVAEAGTGFGFLAVVMGYFPVLYSAFSRREVSISLLDARAGSPPTAAELLRRHAYEGADQALSLLLVEWERWSAELLESHISYPLLCYFRSQHTNQSWISALTAILDTSALLIAGVRGHEARQAQLTFAMARHAMVDLAQIFMLAPLNAASDRLPQQRYEELYGLLCQSGVSVCRDQASYERLQDMRKLYEGYAAALSSHFRMPLPPWISTQPHKDNWQAVAKVRAKAEAANPSEAQHAESGQVSQVNVPLIDHHHDF